MLFITRQPLEVTSFVWVVASVKLQRESFFQAQRPDWIAHLSSGVSVFLVQSMITLGAQLILGFL